jgi:hypothetical protein
LPEGAAVVISGSWLFVVESAVAIVKAMSPGGSISNGIAGKTLHRIAHNAHLRQSTFSRFY